MRAASGPRLDLGDRRSGRALIGRALRGCHDCRMARKAMLAALSASGIALGLFSLHVARSDPSFSFVGTSAAAGVAFLVAGWILIACGVGFTLARPANRFGPLLAAAGVAWFLAEWGNPGTGSPLIFTIGLCLYAACPPLVGHAVVAFPAGRVSGWAERVTVATAYVGGVLVLGVIPAVLVDPSARACSECPRNLVALADDGGLADDVTRAGIYLGFAWAVALALLMLVRLVRASSAR